MFLLENSIKIHEIQYGMLLKTKVLQEDDTSIPTKQKEQDKNSDVLSDTPSMPSLESQEVKHAKAETESVESPSASDGCITFTC